MISYAEALRILETEGAKRLAADRTELLPLLECVGRYAAADVMSLDRNPRFDNAAMDGFALLAAETAAASPGNPIVAQVVGCICAGDNEGAIPESGRGCVEIMTGARMPDGPFDAVVRLEDIKERRGVHGELTHIIIMSPVAPGENIRRAGEDIEISQQLFAKGKMIEPQHLLALAMSGYSTLEVHTRPKIAVLSTGNEIVAFDTPTLKFSEIRNSTAPLLCSILTAYGADVRYCGIVRDTADDVRRGLLLALEEQPDIVVTTGGVSVGRFDIIKSILVEMGAKIHFHRVAVRPGKPMLFGEFPAGSPAFFGLPGNPIAVATATRFFIRPYLRAKMGQSREVPHRLALSAEARRPAGLVFFQRGVRDGQGVRVLPGQASFMAGSLLEAEGWIVGNTEADIIKNGEFVEWFPLW